MPISLPRGVSDFITSEAIARKELIDIAEEIFKRYGFYPIETPSIENLDVLNAKSYGDEPSRQIYTIEGENAGLRFDLTVPMARYIAMHSSMPLPFKRYQIGYTWRKDEPQFMRRREFLQADVDIVGSSSVTSDAEAIAAPATALNEMGVDNYKIYINSRVFLNSILSYFGVSEQNQKQAIVTIDKMPKMSADEIILQLSKLSNQEVAQKIVNFINQEGTNEEKLNILEANIKDERLAEEIKKARKLLELLGSYNLDRELVIDLSLARGLDYYTGFVWEFIKTDDAGKRLPTIAAGGRYDNLIGIYAKSSLPACGTSIGIDRVFEMLKTDASEKSYTKLFVAYIGSENEAYAINTANKCRAAGIYTDMNLTERNISKQLDYANAIKCKYVMILGNEERQGKVVRLKNMISGNEELLPLEEAIEIVKKDQE
ncbi:MAG: histidine--tRNA ligase [Candidatus Micrarchaeia archaeon]